LRARTRDGRARVELPFRRRVRHRSGARRRLSDAIEGARTRVAGPPLLRSEPRRREGPDRPGRPDPPVRRDRTHPADGARTPSTIDSNVVQHVATGTLAVHPSYAERAE